MYLIFHLRLLKTINKTCLHKLHLGCLLKPVLNKLDNRLFDNDLFNLLFPCFFFYLFSSLSVDFFFVRFIPRFLLLDYLFFMVLAILLLHAVFFSLSSAFCARLRLFISSLLAW